MPRKPQDNPEWTRGDFAKAERFPRGTSLANATTLMGGKRGRPQIEKPKEAVSIRLDADVIASYRKTGEGWQTRINSDLRKARKLA